MAAHAETQTQAYKATAKGQTPSVSKDREAVKAAILAQYGASVVEESEEEESDEGRISEIKSCEVSAIFSKILQIFFILNREACLVKITKYCKKKFEDFLKFL